MPWLATCDQPLVAVPFLPPGTPVPTKTNPPLVETIEFRFVLDPSHALILSWLDAPDWSNWADGDAVLAADINRSIAGNADVEYFHHPDHPPMFVAPPGRRSASATPFRPGCTTATTVRPPSAQSDVGAPARSFTTSSRTESPTRYGP